MSARLDIRIDSDNAALDSTPDGVKAELCRILDGVKARIVNSAVEEEREMEDEPSWLSSYDDAVLRDVNGNKVGLMELEIVIEVDP